ncbi:MAG: rhomboid family intramembrane serine protease [Desulfobacteraceae bacterium]|nr:rhomboid family intramembrane serine protease [Desulfobacteraceae bacterium]
MIPLKDENPAKHVAVVNYLLLFINITVFLLQVFYFPEGLSHWIGQYGFVPRNAIAWATTPADLPVWTPLTVFTSMFMHGGWMHIAGNALFLYIFGDNVEDVLGHFRYLCFYLACGLAATSAHAISNMHSVIPTIGASGAIAGVLGAYLFLFPKARVHTLIIIVIFFRIVKIPAFILLIYWIAIQVVSATIEQSSNSGGIAWFAHIGGFLAGFLLIMMMKKNRRRPY